MKKLRIILGTLVLSLAIVGATAAKKNVKFTTYWFQSAPTVCSSENITVDCANGHQACTDASGNNLFSMSGDLLGHCQNQLFLKP